MLNRIAFLVVLFSSSGCFNYQAYYDSVLTPGSGVSGVLHLASDDRYLAAVPLLDCHRVLTIGPCPVANIVDGRPVFTVPESEDNDAVDRKASRTSRLVVVCAYGPAFKARLPVVYDAGGFFVDEELIVSGFEYDETPKSPAEFFSIEAIGLTTRVAQVRRKRNAPGESTLLDLRVPTKDYRGFVGGPVARRTRSGQYQIIGIVTKRLQADDGYAILEASTIPKSVYNWGRIDWKQPVIARVD